MPSFPESHQAFDNENEFKRPPDNHPYWANQFYMMQEYGFSREFLVSLSEADALQNGRLHDRLTQAASSVEASCRGPQDSVGSSAVNDYYNVAYEPEYIANALLRPRKDFACLSGTALGETETLMEYLIESEDIDDSFEFDLFEAYHPHSRLIMPFQPGVRQDGTLVDAEGSASEHPSFVDERGKLLDILIE